MLLLKTAGPHIPTCVRESKHALSSRPTLSHNEILLISETLATLSTGLMPIRYAMRFRRFREDNSGESVRLWGKSWPIILDAHATWELAKPFRMRDVQVSDKNYEQGGPVVHIDPEDEAVIRRSGLLKSREEAEFQAQPVTPEQKELTEAFVRLWNQSVGGPEYDKADWSHFWGLLLRRGVVR